MQTGSLGSTTLAAIITRACNAWIGYAQWCYALSATSCQNLGAPVMNGDPDRACVYAGNGHCILGGYAGSGQTTNMLSHNPLLQKYFEDNLPELGQRLGEQRRLVGQNYGCAKLERPRCHQS